MSLYKSLLLWVIATSALCHAQSENDRIVQQFDSEYLSKIVTLRKFYPCDHLSFGSDGALLNKCKEAPWVLASKLRITKIQMRSDKLLLNGERLIVIFNGPEHIQYVPTKAEVRIEMDTPLQSDATVVSSQLAKIFVTANDEFADLVPDYWKSAVLRLEGHPQPSDPTSGLPRAGRRSC